MDCCHAPSLTVLDPYGDYPRPVLPLRALDARCFHAFEKRRPAPRRGRETSGFSPFNWVSRSAFVWRWPSSRTVR